MTPKCCGLDSVWVENVVGKGYNYCRECKKEVFEGGSTLEQDFERMINEGNDKTPIDLDDQESWWLYPPQDNVAAPVNITPINWGYKTVYGVNSLTEEAIKAAVQFTENTHHTLPKNVFTFTIAEWEEVKLNILTKADSMAARLLEGETVTLKICEGVLTQTTSGDSTEKDPSQPSDAESDPRQLCLPLGSNEETD